MKKALISGITGQDGAYLAEFLLEKGYEVHGIKRRASSFNTERIDHLYEDPHTKGRRFILHYGDLTDSSNLIRIIQQVQPDEIYNLAAQSHVKVSFDSPEYTADTDGLGTLRLLEAIRLLGLEKRLVFIRHQPLNYTAWSRRFLKRKAHPFIRALPMPVPNSMPTGSRSIIGRPTACMPATGFCSIMNPLFVAKPLLPEKLPDL